MMTRVALISAKATVKRPSASSTQIWNLLHLRVPQVRGLTAKVQDMALDPEAVAGHAGRRR